MKKDPLAGVLTAALVVSTLAAAAMCYQFLKVSRDFRFLSEQVTRVNQRRNALNTFALELNDYARRNPAIEPMLDKLNLRLRVPTNPAPTHP